MITEFKPLEQIADDESIGVGDLILLRKRKAHQRGTVVKINAVIYNGPDTYVRDEESPAKRGGFEKGTRVEGVRVFDEVVNGKPTLREYGHSTVFADREKGLLIPFNYDPAEVLTPDTDFRRLETHQYALVAKATDLPDLGGD